MIRMAEGKRYYWLKLYDDFFDSKRIKKLRRMAGGDTYTIIYFKLQLIAMKHDGVISWTGLEENFADELALDLDESPDDIKVTLSYLLSCGLAETSDDINFFFPYAVSNVGSEGSSAQRVREHREKQKALQCNTDVTEVKQICNGEKEKEKEKEKNKSKSKSKKNNVDVFVSFAGDNDELLTALKDFEKMRNQIKKPMTDRAKEMLINKLSDISSNIDIQIKVLNQSTLNCWSSVYPLKNDKSSSPSEPEPKQYGGIYI